MNKKLKLEWHSPDREKERKSVLEKKQGRSVFEKLAWHYQQEITDPVNGEEINFSKRHSVSDKGHLVPDNVPESYKDPVNFWQEAEQADRQKRRSPFSFENTALTIHLDLPQGLTKEEQIKQTRDFAEQQFTSVGVGVTYSIGEIYRDANGNENYKRGKSNGEYRAEFTYSTRKLTPAGFGDKWNAENTAQQQRAAEVLRQKWEAWDRTYKREEPQQEQPDQEQQTRQERVNEAYSIPDTPTQEISQEPQRVEPKQPAIEETPVNNAWEEHKARVKQELGSALKGQDEQPQEQLQGYAIPEIKQSKLKQQNKITSWEEFRDNTTDQTSIKAKLRQQNQITSWEEFNAIDGESERTREERQQAREQQPTQAVTPALDLYDSPTDHTRIKAREELKQATPKPGGMKITSWEEFNAIDEENERARQEREQNREQGQERDR
jgi:MobA/MobL family